MASTYPARDKGVLLCMQELHAELALCLRAEVDKPEEVRGGSGTAPDAGIGSKNRTISNTAEKRPRANKKAGKKTKLYCICKTPYDNTKFYVGCEQCRNWFHGACVGVTEEMTKTMDEYLCPDCSKELHCLCRQLYDNSQFYICCDRCQAWYYGRWSEADNIDEYLCPNCQKNYPVVNKMKPI